MSKYAKSILVLITSESAKSFPLSEASVSAKFFPLLEACFPVLKTEWEAFISLGDILVNEVGKDFICYFRSTLECGILISYSEQAIIYSTLQMMKFNVLIFVLFILQLETKIETWDCRRSPDQLCGSNFKVLFANILICIFWRLWKAFISVVMPAEVSVVRDVISFFSRS